MSNSSFSRATTLTREPLPSSTMRPTNHLSNPSSHPHVPDETTTTTQTTPPHVSQDTSHRHSHSNTSKHLYTYHFNTSKIPHSLRLTYRSRAKAYLKQNGYFVDMEIFQVVSSILFFFVFIAELICNMKLTQNPTNRGRIMISGFYFVDLALCLGVLVMLLIGLLVAKHKKRFILQLSSLIDIFTIVPLIPLLVYAIVKLFLIGGFNSQIFYRNDGLDVNMFSISIVIGFFRLLRLIRILFVLTWKKNILNYMFENSFGFGPSLQVQVVTLILIVIILLLFFSGTFHLIEFLFGTAVLGMCKLF